MGPNESLKKIDAEEPYKRYKLSTSLKPIGQDPQLNAQISENINSQKLKQVNKFGQKSLKKAPISSTSGLGLFLNIFNNSPLKNLKPKDYNLLNIQPSFEDLPYLFGMGLPAKYNCNCGFDEEMKTKFH